MKKIFSVFIAVLSVLACVSCGARKADNGGGSLVDSVMSENANGVIKGNEYTFQKLPIRNFVRKQVIQHTAEIGFINPERREMRTMRCFMAKFKRFSESRTVSRTIGKICTTII